MKQFILFIKVNYWWWINTNKSRSVYFSSVQSLSRVRLFATPWTTARPPCPSPTPTVYPNSSPLSWWCHLTISSSVVPFSSCLQSFPTSGSLQMSQLFTSVYLDKYYISLTQKCYRYIMCHYIIKKKILPIKLWHNAFA